MTLVKAEAENDVSPLVTSGVTDREKTAEAVRRMVRRS
jgi:hypothetical protein